MSAIVPMLASGTGTAKVAFAIATLGTKESTAPSSSAQMIAMDMAIVLLGNASAQKVMKELPARFANARMIAAGRESV